MKLHLSKALGLVLFLALSIQNTHAQCPVTAYASKSTVSCGDPVTLTAVASGCIPLNNNFNNGSLGTWSATTGAVVTNGNGAPNASYNCVGPPPEGANCLWMGATVSGTRTVTTNDYNLTSCGGGSTNSGSICFWMKYSTQGGPDPCEGIDLPAEGISVQYSTNGGANWTTLQYYDPNGGYDPVLTNWNYYCLNIPTAAIGPNTRFRWLQSQNSGAGFDTWGLDDVSIILNGPGYTYDWAHDAQGPASTSNTPDVNPTSTTTYTVTYTNGVETCTSDVTVNVILPTVSAAADKVLVCEGTPVNLTSQSSLVAVPITSCGINPDASCNPLTQEAGEVQVGNGTFVNTNNSISGNTFGDFGDNNMRTQIIYRANELIAAGMVPGQINNIQFNIASILTNGTYSNFRISIGCTSQNAFTSSATSFVGGLQNVYGPVTLPSMNPGWNTFFFDNSYNWDGTSNIVVQICWTTLSSDDREVYTMDHNTTFASLAQAVENNFDGFNVCTSTTFYDEYSRRPNTRFGYCKPRNIVLNYNWTSNPIGFTANTQNTTATPNGPTYYIVGVNNSGAPAGCTVYDSVLVDTYKPTVSVNPNPANICPPGTTSANLVSTSTTNPNFPAQRTFTNNIAQPIGDAGGGFVATCGTAGTPVTSVIAVNNIVPATLAANPVFQVAVNMNTQANGDYLIELISPSGNTITLKPAQTGAGANMTNTRFRTGGAAFGGGAAPYNGIFAPNQPFANLTGNVNGNWTLRVTDLCKPFGNGTSTGSLLSWSITFNTENYVSTYAWSPAAGLSSTNTANTVASPASSTVYTLTVTDAVGCSNSTTVPVNVNSAPSVPVNDTAICAGNSATLTAVPFDGGGGTYSWSPGGQTTQSITVTPGSTTGYTVSYSSGGCTGTGTGTVTVSPTPTVSVNSTTICSGQSTTLTATPSQPGGTYLWSNGATSASITVSPGSTQTYSVTYTLNGCTASQSGTVTVNPSPTVGVNNVTICNGQTANLTATPSVGGGTYSWFPGGQTSPSISVTPTSTTNYTVNYTLNGCTATNTGTVTVNGLPSVTVNNPSICSGNSATLTATVNPSGGTFSWSPGGMTTNPVTVSPASTTVYTVTYTALNGCVNSANSTVTVNPSVTVAANDPTICAGQTATLTATPSTPGGTYSWTPGGATSQNLNVSPGTTTNYTVNYTLNGCTASDVATVTVNPVPTVTLASTTICSGTSTTLSPTVSPSGGTFSWSPGGQTTSSITVTPASTTNYTVNYTANGCSGSASATVTVQSTPSISVNSPTICSGQTATVTATPAQGGGTYSWSPGGQTTQTINVSPTSTTNYTVTYTIGGCSGTQTSTVTVNPTPTMTVNSPTICNGATATITASPTPMGGTYTWSPGGQTTQTINVSPTSTSNYTVNYSLNGCTANATSTVTVTPRPNVTVNNPTICSGQTATINATVSPTGGTYSWAPGGQTTASISVSPTTTSTYTVTYTGPSGCTNTATSTVTVNAASSVTVNDPTICNGSSATLTASPSTGGGAYLWSPGGATSQSITVSPSSTANYTVTYTANGCSSSDVGTITVNPIPTVNLANATVCNGSSTTLTPTVTPPGGTYLWGPGGQTTPSITVSPATSTNYSVNYTANGCLNSATNTVNVAPALTAAISGGGTICQGQTTTLTVNFNGAGPYTIVYNDGSSNQTISGITANPYTLTTGNAGTYTLVSVSNPNCTGTVSGSATVNVNTNVNYTNVTGTCDGVGNYTITFEITGGDPSSYNVTGMNGGTISGSAPYIFTSNPIAIGTPNYSFTLTDGNGCNTQTIAGNQACGCVASATISGGGTICAGGTANITIDMIGTGPWDVEYSDGSTTTMLSNISTPYTFSVTAAGTYTLVSVEDATNCVGSTNGSATVTVQPNPTVALSVSGNNPICLGETATIVATPSQVGGSYLWGGGQTTQSITVTPAAAGTINYDVTYTLNGCSGTDNINLVVNPVPTVTANDTTICNGSSATIYATASPAGGSYLWSPSGNTTSSFVAAPTATTNYALEYTLNGCVARDTTTVTVNPTPSVGFVPQTICEGETATLTANVDLAGGTYLWSPGGETTPSITVSPATTTNYSVTYTLNGCSDVATGDVTVNPVPTVTVINDTICDGETATLVAQVDLAGGSFLWSPGTHPDNDTIQVAPNSTTTYSVDYTLNGCTSSATGDVEVNPSPSLSVNSGTICGGDSIVLMATTSNPGGVFTWSPGTFGDTANITVSPAATTVYNLSYTLNGCTATTAATVTVVPPPTVSINDTTICEGETGTLTATPSSGGGTYLWSPGGETTQTISVSPISNSTYTVEYTIGGCSATASGNVTVNAIPTVDVTSGTTICIGDSAVLYATPSAPGGTYAWQTPPANNETADSIIVYPTTTTQYFVTYTLNGCSAIDSGVVNVDQLPVLTVTPDTICEGETAVLMANVDLTGGSFTWTPGGETTQSITVSPITTSNYDVNYVLGTCSVDATGTVQVYSLPTVTVSNDSICVAEQGNLVATVDITGGSYSWSPGTHPDNDTLTDSPSSTTTYTVIYTVNGCSDTSSGEIFVRPTPAISVNDATICEGDSATLTAASTISGGVFSWTPGAFGNVNTITVSPSDTTIYTVTYAVDGCSATDSSTVTVNYSSPIVVNDTTICEGSTAVLTATPATTGGSFLWTPGGQTTQTINVTPANSTTYTVVYTINGCTSDTTGNVTVNPVPTVSVTPDSIAICNGSSATLTALPSLNGGTYSWVSPPANNQTTASITVSPNTTTIYTVVYNLNGCLATDSGKVQVNYHPTLTLVGDTICEGELAMLTASTNADPSTITWSPSGLTGDTIFVSPNTSTQYIANVSLFGCATQDTVDVNVTPTPTASATNGGPYCAGSDIELFGNSNSATDFEWYGPNGFYANTQNATNPNSTPADSGIYQLTVSINGCTAIDFTTVTIIIPDTSAITPAGPYCGNDAPVNLQVNFPGGTWSGSGITNASTGLFDPSVATVGNNTINWTPGAGECQTPSTATIVVNPVPVVDIYPLEPYGCAPFSTGFVDATTPSSTSLSWDFGNGMTSTSLDTAYTTYLQPGLYTVTVTSTSADGCSNTEVFTDIVEALNNAVADFDWNPSEISSMAPIVSFLNNSQHADDFSWTFGTFGGSFEENPTFDFGTFYGAVDVTLVANNFGNCADTITKQLFIKEELIYYVPNTFTPDGDKFNQTFSPVFVSGFDPKDFVMLIYNRWGELIYETHDHSIGWDGTYQNQLVQDGVYTYVFRFKRKEDDDKVEVSGLVNVIR